MPMTRQPLTTEHILLGYLAEHPMHGYELHQRLEDPAALGTVWRVKQAQLYALLTKLEGDGLVESTLEPQDPKPPRKIFNLTNAGQRTLDHWLQNPVPHGRELRIEFLAKLYFVRKQDPTTALALVHAQKNLLQEWLAKNPSPPSDETYRYLVHAFRAGQIHAMLEWLDTCTVHLDI
jgi:PadR family transcriptional regulator, regulatory protein AphA